MLTVALLFAFFQANVQLLNSVEISYPNRVYRTIRPCDVRRVNFRNFTYFTGEWMSGERTPTPTDPVRVSRGAYHWKEDFGFEDVTVEKIARPTNSATAVYLLHNYGGGSSNQNLVVLVFRCVNGALTNTQLIVGDGHGDGAGVDLTAAGTRLTVHSVDDYSLGHCCPRFLETGDFAWIDDKYVLQHSAVKEFHYKGNP